MKSITVKITSKYREYDVAHEVMLDDVIEGFKYVNDFDFELVKDDDENPFDMSNPIYEAGYNQGHFDAKYSEEIAREMDEQKEV